MAGKFTRKSKEQLAPLKYCIVVEGIKTENLYFKDFKPVFDRRQLESYQAKRNRGEQGARHCSVDIVSANGRSFENVAQVAITEASKGYERVWCVVDADFFVRLVDKQKADAEKTYNRAVKAGVKFIFSRPCFEVWFRLHFNSGTTAWIDGETSKRNIAILWSEYEEKPKKHWSLLQDKLPLARTNALKVRTNHGCPPKEVKDCDASSDVDSLFDDLDAIDPNAPLNQ